MAKSNCRDLGYSKQPGRCNAAVAGYDFVVVGDENRIGEPETGYAVGDLPYLLLGMRASVPLVRLQGGEFTILDVQAVLGHVDLRSVITLPLTDFSAARTVAEVLEHT
jgi:hypothetical protein